ncbi:hypothetical protein Tco_0580739 [Tanacetum coccineum]
MLGKLLKLQRCLCGINFESQKTTILRCDDVIISIDVFGIWKVGFCQGCCWDRWLLGRWLLVVVGGETNVEDGYGEEKEEGGSESEGVVRVVIERMHVEILMVMVILVVGMVVIEVGG